MTAWRVMAAQLSRSTQLMQAALHWRLPHLHYKLGRSATTSQRATFTSYAKDE